MHVDGSVSGNAEMGMSGVSGPDTVAAWARVKRRLRAELGEDVFASWFARLELVEVVDGTARLTVPTRFLKSWIESHYLDRVLNTFRSEVESVSRLDVSVRGPSAAVRPATSTPKTSSAASPLARLQAAGNTMPSHGESSVGSDSETHPAPRGDAGGDLNGAPLDNRLTFASFVVGRSNALAHAAAERVARHDGQGALYNPLYFHAGVGLGKTHLLHGIGHAARESGRRVIYLTADRFMYGFVNALKTQNALAFKERLRAIDLLILDDVQFIQGKSIQAEFGHTINALIDAGRQVVVASDRPPTELEALEERVRSRLAGGLVVEIGTLDEQLRTSILSARLAAVQVSHPSFEVSPTVATYVARAITANGRDLEGAVNRLLAHATLTGAAVTMETAEAAIRDLVKNREPKRIKIEDIQKLVASRYNVSRSDILSERRTAAVVKPRQIAMYLSKVLTLRSLPEIGRRFGGRDHTTVLHAVRKIDKLIGEDNVLNDEVELLKRMLQD
ncbi:chromosomal replication initiator protein DnaA [Methylobacterium sp. Leaf117]|uniref:chromosomal replication initiator protein DnaA n=1 Tax=Methylobacterium sp. Leaf117 TaxID=1736260 RepID=UPI0006F79E3D|nr:chromosomal replication initiator protein DnaA [Methylobacterium sp. Leaf117]KQP92256.1 chromosomal replication initiation protein [Methylobacterium sp. Leaf117]